MDWLFIIFIIVLIIILYLIYILKTYKKKVYLFVGPSESGKTRALHHLLNIKDITTVPSLQDNTKETRNCIIYDIVPRKNKDTFKETYGFGIHETIPEISKMDVHYFFFLKNGNDIIDYEKGYSTHFVFCGKRSELKDFPQTLSDKLIVLNNDYDVLKRVLKIQD